MEPFQKFSTWPLNDRKSIFYVKVKDELMKVEIMKKRDKGFIYLMQAMICDKKLFKFLWRKGSLNILSFVSKSAIYPEKNTKSLKTQLPFKINFCATVNEKGVFRTWRSGRGSSKRKRKSQVYIHIWRDQCLKHFLEH